MHSFRHTIRKCSSSGYYAKWTVRRSSSVSTNQASKHHYECTTTNLTRQTGQHVPVGKPHHNIMNSCLLCRLIHLLLRSIHPTILDVVENTFIEQHCVLRNHTHVSSQTGKRNVRERCASYSHSTAVWIIKPAQQAEDSRLSTAAGSHLSLQIVSKQIIHIHSKMQIESRNNSDSRHTFHPWFMLNSKDLCYCQGLQPCCC